MYLLNHINNDIKWKSHDIQLGELKVICPIFKNRAPTLQAPNMTFQGEYLDGGTIFLLGLLRARGTVSAVSPGVIGTATCPSLIICGSI